MYVRTKLWGKNQTSKVSLCCKRTGSKNHVKAKKDPQKISTEYYLPISHFTVLQSLEFAAISSNLFEIDLLKHILTLRAK